MQQWVPCNMITMGFDHTMCLGVGTGLSFCLMPAVTSHHFIFQECDVNAVTGGGDTPLHLASQYGRVAVVSLLVASGADVKIKSRGKSAKDIAESEEIARMLEEAQGKWIGA